MRKEFNDTGLCIKGQHYMVDTSSKLDDIVTLIDKGKYFTINRPRQFGKTTTAYLLGEHLKDNPTYLYLDISFEVAGDESFQNQATFCQYFIHKLKKAFERQQLEAYTSFIEHNIDQIQNFEHLSEAITNLCRITERKLVLSIDEVDKASNNLLFLQFLALLRDKYLFRGRGTDDSFQSVILVGVHDIKNLKRKLRPEDAHSLNSPWNIAIDFTIDLAFDAAEIATMLQQYVTETGTLMDIPTIAARLYYYTSGYPYLVSKMCKVIDEVLTPEKWTLDTIEESFKYLVNPIYETTLFDDLAKNLNNNPDVYASVLEVVINGKKLLFNPSNPVISLAKIYGILKSDEKGFCQTYNRVFEKRIYDMMLSRQETSQQQVLERSLFEGDQGELLLKDALLSFQAFMQEHHSQKDNVFLEREGRLLFLSFLKPILNGKGFDFKEPVVGDERRTDIVITYLNHRYVLELKRWQGDKYHQKGLQQLSDYLDLYQLKEGFLLIYDFRKEKTYKHETIQFQGKEIFAVWV